MRLQHLHTQPRFSEATIHQGVVYLAGQLAADLSGDIHQQTHDTLTAIEQLLTECGSDKSLILTTTIYLKDIAQDYAAFNSIWDEWLKDVKAPPRTCVEAKLYHPDVLVEVTMTAIVRQ